ncbi:DUF7344 domain-containing protein [Natronococcus occultus]|uniref:DUF7344 domain-containing protein n=1 Tax=Natronococcus occultus SP4 TaxID=694430 RepID=L0K0C5_9EURY|nr:hypothetical protein [Natronococcus occultus]AGB37578.1 hypothetical protein Natoc_1780 [Natronococcus occultus SP4]
MRKRGQGSKPVSTATPPSLDLIFDLLSSRRRRYALYYLSERTDGVAGVDELADGIVRLENETGHGETDAAQHRRAVRAELQHSHLPKLADTSLLEHDPRSDTVRYWSQPSLEEWLEHAKHKEL